ncbi:hypothetical protein [Bifidobacterium castoris]|uniref:Uncharacterized protein n=1 Tax=Bifidobacterium castoris TaxID=2306972 RepID=A0A430FA75_9BIFI|nr:hypothetical protein [Bifidobacterium castoris]RSX49740.1 hypothetical protein D2E22_0201 [Bifidobacterium castoris]
MTTTERTSTATRTRAKSGRNTHGGFDEEPATHEQIARLIARYSDPYRTGTPAAKLTALLHDPELCRELVYAYVQEELIWAAKPVGRTGKPRTPQTLSYPLVRHICSHPSIETILQRRAGFPATLMRAGCRYYTLRRRLAAENMLDGLTDADVWNMAADEEVARQLEQMAAGRRGEPRWPPYADGSSANPDCQTPDTRRMLGCGGLDEWNRRLAELEGLGSVRTVPMVGDNMEDEDYCRALSDIGADTGAPSSTETAALGESFTPDAAWLRDHGITADMVERLPQRQRDMLEEAGIDTAALIREAHRADLDRLPEPAPRSRWAADPARLDTMAARLEPVVGRPLARRLALSYTGRSWQPDSILTSAGLPVRLARTLLATGTALEDTDVARWDAACTRLNTLRRPRGWRPGRHGMEDARRILDGFTHRLRVRFLADAGVEEGMDAPAPMVGCGA